MRWIRLNARAFGLTHNLVYRPADDDDDGNVSGPSATTYARTKKRSGHAAPPGIVFDVRRDGGEFRLVYRLDAAAKVEVAVFDAAGRLVETVASGRRAAGQRMIALALRHPAEGVYSARIKVNDEVIVRESVIAGWRRARGWDYVVRSPPGTGRRPWVGLSGADDGGHRSLTRRPTLSPAEDSKRKR